MHYARSQSPRIIYGIILFKWHSGKGKTTGRWNGSVVAWLGLGVGGKFNYKGVAQGNFWGVMEGFYILIEVIVMWIYACVKTRKTAHQEKCVFTVCKLYFKRTHCTHNMNSLGLWGPSDTFLPLISLLMLATHKQVVLECVRESEGGLLYHTVHAKYITPHAKFSTL